MNSHAIPVLMCADERYFRHMGVAIASLLANNPHRHFALTIVLDQRLPGAEVQLDEIIAGFGNASIAFMVFDVDRLAGYPVPQHFSPAIYLRLFAATLLGPEVDRALYLDCDLVVCGPIDELWDMPLRDAPLAAVRDPYLPARQVNSGVMVMNLRQWRAERAEAAFTEYLSANAQQLDYPDQQAINAVFAGRIKLLPIKWNVQAGMADASPGRLCLDRGQFRAALRQPGIVHYTTGRKPWNYKKAVHYTGLYRHYLAMTPWRDTPPEGWSLRNRVLRALRLTDLRLWLGHRFALLR